MKVLLISPLPPPKGGIAIWTEGYIDYAKQNKLDYGLVNTAVMGKRIKNYTKAHFLEEIKRAFYLIGQVKKEAKTGEYTNAHLNTSCGYKGMLRDFFMVKLLKKRNIKTVLHCHCNVETALEPKRNKKLFLKIARLCTEIIVLNQASKNVVQKLGFHCEKIGNFLVGKTATKKVCAKSLSTILYVGHLLLKKGVDLIFRIAKVFPHKTFVLSGAISEDILALEKPKNIVLTGEVSRDKVFEQMQTSDLFLFPSHTEGYPTVIMEALSCGLPIVCTEVGAIPEMISDKNAVFMGVDSDDDAKNAILKLEDCSFRQAMSDANIAVAKDKFSIDSVMPKYLECYDK